MQQRRRRAPAARPVSRTTSQVRALFSEGPQSGVFTDGSCSGNPGPGGWGVVHVRDGEVLAERHGHDPATTNNRMELTALIEGLRLLEPGGATESTPVYSDSRLIVDTITRWAAGWERNGWRRSSGPVANVELVREAYALARERPNARIQWIRAHDGSLWNEYADALATAYLRAEV
jgi:ribonuclease HI